MLKRKYSNKPDYKHQLKYQYTNEYINNPDFEGYLTLFYFNEVEKPLITTFNGLRYSVADQDYIWLQFLPKDQFYCLTALIDDDHNIIEWYFDIIKNQGVIDGVPYFDDIYLDIVVKENFQPALLDEDELLEARMKGIISENDVKEAYRIADDVINNQSDPQKLTNLTLKYLPYMLEKLQENN